jgi:ABC-2 type transport system permease protein
MSGSQATVSVYSDAGYFLVYKQTLSGVLKSTATFSAGVEVKRLMAKGATIEQALDRRDPVSLKTNLLFNPAGGYNTFVIPGLMIVILQQTLLIGRGLGGGTQHEIGRRRFIFPGGIKPASVLPVFFGKAGAYFMLYMVNVIITQIWVYDWFSLPNKGEMLAVFALMIPFLLAITFIGLGVSTFFKKREHSILFMVFLSPLVLFLSGLSWPTEAIPVWLNKLALIFPSTTMVPAFLRVRTMGATLNQVAPEYWFLVIQAILYGLISIALFYKNARIAAKKGSN